MLLLRLLGRGPGHAAIAWLAAMFALVHPLGVEVVAGQVGASDLLATALSTLAVILGSRRTGVRLAGAIAAASLGMLAKEMWRRTRGATT